MSRPPIFRDQALDRIGSPEELDRLVRVTSPRYWIGLSGLLVVVVTAVLWAFLSTIPTTESGFGFLLPEGGLRPVQAATSGELSSFGI
ncbi:MAG: NHLP bacteriocin system secretion protein, partial [Gaiellales bacterium]